MKERKALKQEIDADNGNKSTKDRDRDSIASQIFVVVFVVLLVGLGISIIEVELPPHLQGIHHVEGQIVSCEFKNLSGNSNKFFLGFTLDATNVPYLRMNPLLRERQNYQELCSGRAHVRVTYTAKKRLVGPVRYWVKTMERV